MKHAVGLAITLCCLASTGSYAQKAGNKKEDASPHKVQFVQVDKQVRLEVLDWGGTGRPVVLLAGLGFDAHVFDAFAPRLALHYHVYGITRRGFGASSHPAPTPENYSADRLADDVLEVIDALKLQRPILVGHSIAGEELSSIGIRHPEKVAGLVYLDAGYSYAYYDKSHGDFVIDLNYLRKELTQLTLLAAPRVRKARIARLLNTSLPQFHNDLLTAQKILANIPDTAPAPPDTPAMRAATAVAEGEEKFGGVKCPALAIYADPHNMSRRYANNPAARAAAEAEDKAQVSAQADAFQAGNPSARVVRIADADHFIFRSNEAQVLRVINKFIADLPQ